MTTPVTAAFDLVVPTVGRASLERLLSSMAADLNGPDPGSGPRSLVVVDDRPGQVAPLSFDQQGLDVTVLRSGGRGPAAARNRGWRRCSAPWVCFLDDDVQVRPGWSRALDHDLRRAGDRVAAVQGVVHVPMPTERRPTDRERNVAGLATARWITADMAIRRSALIDVAGFDERFRRAYREDSDLALRLMDAGWELSTGGREVDHPVGKARWHVTVGQQRGNADDALMRRLHGPGWRTRAHAPRGALGHHIATNATLAGAGAAALAGWRRAAVVLGAAWLAQAGRFAWQRIAPGPRNAGEVASMVITSIAIPPAAAWWATAGRVRAARLAPRGVQDRWHLRRPLAVLFDRDGTLVHDVPYNGDPSAVRPVDGAREALDRLRAAGVRIGVVSNQSGVARGLLTAADVDRVNARVAELLGPFDTVCWCPHGPDDSCACRKPAPGLIHAAAKALGVDARLCAVIGDIGADVEAGLAAGARPILVPTLETLAPEIADAPEVATTLVEAVDALLTARRLPAGHRALSCGVGSHFAGERAS